MKTILITNDDGVHAPGLLTLKQILSQIANVVVLAPERNRSAVSHTRTMHKPLRVKSVTLRDGSTAHYCNGSPADCVSLGVGGVLGVQPDLVVSGINDGHNISVDTYYSGTVAGAREAVHHNVPGIAVSTVFESTVPDTIDTIRQDTAHLISRLAQHIFQSGFPEHTLLNVNVPGLTANELAGAQITRLGHRRYSPVPLERFDQRGEVYYWPGGQGARDVAEDGTDVGALANGFVSITPITLDSTHYDFMAELGEWELSE